MPIVLEESDALLQAAAILELRFGGIAHLNDTGGASLPDLRLQADDGSTRFVEVTQEVDHRYAEAVAVADAQKTVPLSAGQGHWLVHVPKSARIRKASEALPKRIAALPPTVGVLHRTDDGGFYYKGATSPDSAYLRVYPDDDIIAAGFDHSNSSDLGSHLASKVSEVANIPDNRNKLGTEGSILFIHVHSNRMNLAVQAVLHGELAPEPTLPSGCTSVVCSSRFLQQGVAVYERSKGWTPFVTLGIMGMPNPWKRSRLILERWRQVV